MSSARNSVWPEKRTPDSVITLFCTGAVTSACAAPAHAERGAAAQHVENIRRHWRRRAGPRRRRAQRDRQDCMLPIRCGPTCATVSQSIESLTWRPSDFEVTRSTSGGYAVRRASATGSGAAPRWCAVQPPGSAGGPLRAATFPVPADLQQWSLSTLRPAAADQTRQTPVRDGGHQRPFPNGIARRCLRRRRIADRAGRHLLSVHSRRPADPANPSIGWDRPPTGSREAPPLPARHERGEARATRTPDLYRLATSCRTLTPPGSASAPPAPLKPGKSPVVEPFRGGWRAPAIPATCWG